MTSPVAWVSHRLVVAGLSDNSHKAHPDLGEGTIDTTFDGKSIKEFWNHILSYYKNKRKKWRGGSGSCTWEQEPDP